MIRLDSLSMTLLFAACLLLPLTMVGQDQGNLSQEPGSPGGNTVTVTGCLTGSGDRYTLGTMSDKLYLLSGDTASFKKLNARRVQATGTVAEPAPHTSREDVLSQQPPTLTVTKLKKVADGCN